MWRAAPATTPRGRLSVGRAVLKKRLATAGDLLAPLYQIVIDRDALLRAGMFVDDPQLGSLDAIHLVCALEIGPALDSFVTYDKTLARVATELGLPVEQPA